MDNNYEYKTHAIVYIDILGVKDIIDNDNTGESILKIKSIVKSAEQSALKVLPESDKCSELKYKFFSDNVIFAIDLEQPSNAIYLLWITCIFVDEILRSCGWLCRGAFTYGDLYIDDEVVWGKGLVRSYYLENSIANYPRIIFDPDCMKKINGNFIISNTLTKLDFDGLYYLDYIWFVNNPYNRKNAVDDYRIAIKNIRNIKKTDERIRQKLDWFENYINEFEKFNKNQ